MSNNNIYLSTQTKLSYLKYQQDSSRMCVDFQKTEYKG